MIVIVDTNISCTISLGIFMACLHMNVRAPTSLVNSLSPSNRKLAANSRSHHIFKFYRILPTNIMNNCKNFCHVKFASTS
jgi:hypothetical protein